MRTLSFMLAFAFVLAGPSMAGSTDSHLPGVGTFAYTGSPIARRRPTAWSLRPAEATAANSGAGKGHHGFSCLGCGDRGVAAAHGVGQPRPSRISCSRFNSGLAAASRSARRIRAPVRAAYGGTLGPSGSRLRMPARSAAAAVEDNDLREALLRGIGETGVPTIETEWVPASKQSEIGPTFTEDRQADAAMHVRAGELGSSRHPRCPRQRPSRTLAAAALFRSLRAHSCAECISACARLRRVILAPEISLIWPAGTGAVIDLDALAQLQIDDVLFPRHLAFAGADDGRGNSARPPSSRIETKPDV